MSMYRLRNYRIFQSQDGNLPVSYMVMLHTVFLRMGSLSGGTYLLTVS